jgi:hypothetical protein
MTTQEKYIRKDVVLSISLPKELLTTVDSLCSIHKIKRSQLVKILLVQEVEKNASRAIEEMVAKMKNKNHAPDDTYLKEVDGKVRLSKANSILKKTNEEE